MALTDEQEDELTKIFGDRFIVAKHELLPFSTDIGTLPREVGLIMNNMPDALVQPVKANEIRDLYAVARRHGIPLIPRGAGTSGYGGAIPLAGGITVDMRRMDRIIEIDEEKLTVTTEPGISWYDLQFELNRRGLDLQCYPSSALAATVGGWISQGGDGIGSLKYGPVNDSVIELEVVLPNGRIVLSRDLQLFCDTEGILGIITKAKLKVKKLTEIEPTVFSVRDNHVLMNAIEEILNEGPLPFTIKLEESNYVQIKKKLWPKNELYPYPKKHCVVLVAYEGDQDEIQTGLNTVREVAGKHDGIIHSKWVADYEWKERFYPMRIKQLGPSLVAGQAHVPLESLGRVLGDFQSQQAPMRAGADGFVTSRDAVTIMGYYLEDERNLFFMLSWVQSFSILDIAERYGGHTHSTGLWLADRAEEYFGKKHLAKIAAAKSKFDSDNISNPGKIFGFWFPWVLRFGRHFMRIGFELLNNGPLKTIKTVKWMLYDFPPLKWIRNDM
ncbi:FAD-binding oxidoreductase [Candidatus Thorarchaeota archaeon]|nr:MAG: FAD-binding oxidoreductase [Candidatus Thorarchaeota archaeon]